MKKSIISLAFLFALFVTSVGAAKAQDGSIRVGVGNVSAGVRVDLDNDDDARCDEYDDGDAIIRVTTTQPRRKSKRTQVVVVNGNRAPRRTARRQNVQVQTVVVENRRSRRRSNSANITVTAPIPSVNIRVND